MHPFLWLLDENVALLSTLLSNLARRKNDGEVARAFCDGAQTLGDLLDKRSNVKTRIELFP